MRYLLVILGVIALLGGLGLIKGAQITSLISFGKQAEAAGPPPEAVSVAKATEQSWESTLEAVGTVASSRGVTVSTQAAGNVTRIHFDSGDQVKQGQVLVELDSRVERAQLRALVVRRDLAKTTLGRTRLLAKEGVVAQAQLDNDESQLESAAAEIKALQAQIALKTVRAPFAGKLGIRAVNLGQYLNPGTAITELESEKGTFVDFTLPQEQLSELAVGMPVRVRLEDGSGKEHTGELSAIDPNVDQQTRAIRLRATFPERTPGLRPGMFVRVGVVQPKKVKVVAVPVTAVVHASYGDSVYVVEDGKPHKTARQQFVRTGPRRGDFVAVLEGVKPGQTIVSLGSFKLRNGAPIVEGETKLDPKLDPRPENR